MKRSIRAGQYVRRAVKFEARFAKRADGVEVIEGYASVFGSKNAHDEVMVPGAFSQSVREHQESGRPAIHLLHHDERIALGPSDIAEDSNGLHIRTPPLSTRTAQEGKEEIRAGILNALSIGFSTERVALSGSRMIQSTATISVSLVRDSSNIRAFDGGLTLWRWQVLLRGVGWRGHSRV